MRKSSASDAAVTSAPLLALLDATAEWHTGLPAVCSAGVRLLDRVHFTVHRGDCVVVHHEDPAGARVLLAALSGHPALPPGRRLLGVRQCAAGVRIRRCSIPVDAVGALQAGWQQDPARRCPGGTGSGAAPVVYLLRASRRTPVTAAERHQWRTWAHSVRLRDGAMVIVAPPEEPRPAMTPMSPPGPDTLREGAGPGYQAGEASGVAASVSSGVASRTGVAPRAMWLHHGRLFNLRTWE